MFYNQLKSLIRPQSLTCSSNRKRSVHNIQFRFCIRNSMNKFINVIILIMSLVIVKASAIALYETRTPTATAAGNRVISQSPHTSSHFQATTSEFITSLPQTTQSILGALQPQTDINTTVANHIIRTNIIVGGGGALGEGGGGGGTRNLDLKTKDNMRAKLQQLLQREKDDDEERRQLQQDQQLNAIVSEEQQQHYQQHPSLQQQQQSQHAILAGENAYLLERIDGGVHEQPIYGTWSTKARRPQAPQMANSIATTTAVGVGASSASSGLSSSMQTLIGEVDEHVYDHHRQQRQQQQQHHYERLPRRSSTMTPVRRELHDQIPRPPRLTSRQPSMAVRRQFNDTPMPRDEYRPKPFHFPYDGPMPEEFKKHQQQGSLSGIDDVGNIQDILQKLQLGSLASTKAPALVMMPTGLHISGSYKNLKSSGIANFFRGKRHKKQMQLQFPMPMQMLNAFQTPVMSLMPQPYQQRIAMDQIYPFKPRSPNDINLLAMQQQQQQQQQHLKTQQTKGKKHKKKQKDKKNILAGNNQILHQYPFANAGAELIYPSVYPPYMALNITQAPPLPKRVPFKLNLDIFPVLPPSKNVKPLSSYAMEEARIVSSMRPPTALRNPFMEYFTTPIPPSASSMTFFSPYSQKQPLYSPIRFPGALQSPHIPVAQTSNLQLAYPDQMQKYLQQQQQQQHIYANLLNSQGGHQTPFLPIDCEQPLTSGSAASDSNANQSPIMVHLNVFPKQKPNSGASISTNPFYNNLSATTHNNNNNNIQRTTIQEEAESHLGPIEPRHQARALNDTSQAQIARSDTSSDPQNDLVDFEHPIVAASDNSELPTPAALVGGNPLTDSSLSFNGSRSNLTQHNNYNNNGNSNLEQMVSEAKTASLFRFPVEDLIQFQVHDAM